MSKKVLWYVILALLCCSAIAVVASTSTGFRAATVVQNNSAKIQELEGLVVRGLATPEQTALLAELRAKMQSSPTTLTKGLTETPSTVAPNAVEVYGPNDPSRKVSSRSHKIKSVPMDPQAHEAKMAAIAASERSMEAGETLDNETVAVDEAAEAARVAEKIREQAQTEPAAISLMMKAQEEASTTEESQLRREIETLLDNMIATKATGDEEAAREAEKEWEQARADFAERFPSGSLDACADCLAPIMALGNITTTAWGGTQTGNCGTEGKWYASFTGVANSIYHFDLCPATPGTGTGSADLDVKVCNSTCTILAGVDGSCTGGPSSYLPNDFQWTCPAAGTYYVVIAPYSSYSSHTCTGTVSNTFTLNYYQQLPPSGRCCYTDANCTEVCVVNYQGECTALGGTWATGQTCDGYTCPARPQGSICCNPIPLSGAPVNLTAQTTCGFGNDYINTCLGSYDGGEDIIYAWTPATTGFYTILLTTTTDDDAGILLDSSCPPNATTCIATATGATGLTRTIPCKLLTGGVTYYIMVDNYPSPNCVTSFSLAITACTGYGRCCYGSIYLPLCAEETEATCIARTNEINWTADLGCTATPCTAVPCPVFTVPFTEGFEAPTVVPALPDCWTMQNLDGQADKYWKTLVGGTSYPPHGGLNVAMVTYSSSAGAPDDWMFTPGLSLTQDQPYSFEYWFRSYYGTTYTEWLEVKIGSAPDAASMTETLDPAFSFTSTSVWASHSGSYTPTTTGTYYIGIHYLTAIDRGGVLVDDISLVEGEFTGRCCYGALGSGGCAIETQALCEARVDYYSWTNGITSCATDPCPVLGRCCYSSPYQPLCALETETACLARTDEIGWTVGVDCSTPCEPLPCVPDWTLTDAGVITDANGTCGDGANYNNGCLGGYDGGEENIIEWTVATAGGYEISLNSVTTWTGMAVATTCSADSFTCIHTVSNTSGGLKTIACDYYEAGTYFIFVDTWPSPACITEYTVTVAACTPPPLGKCCYGAWAAPECAYEIEANCLARTNEISWVEGEDCTVPCAEVPTGRCCYGTYSAPECAVEPETICMARATFLYWADGEDCTTACTPVAGGRCCYGSNPHVPSCIIEAEIQCLNRTNEFSWTAGITDCVTDPCPDYTNCPEPSAVADLCANAILVAVPSETYGSTIGMTPDTTGYQSDPAWGGVWYKVVGNGNTFTASTCDECTWQASNLSNFDTRIQVFTCDGCSYAAPVAYNDDNINCTVNTASSEVSWCTLQGQEYWILVEGYPGFNEESGEFKLTMTDDGVACTGGFDCTIGRCCYGDPWAYECEDITAAACAVLGGVWSVGLDCATAPCVNCTVAPANDLCSNVTPEALAIGTPLVYAKDMTCALANDCPDTAVPQTKRIVWEAFTTTECTDVTISYCGSDGLGTGGVYAVLYTDCACAEPGILATTSNWTTCADGNPTLVFRNLAAGTYYHPIQPDNGPNYDLAISAIACADGRCCYDNSQSATCADGVNVFECEALGEATTSGFWFWSEGLDCMTTCPVIPANDRCEDLAGCQTLAIGTPLVLTGNNTNALNNDCVGEAVVWECFTITECMDITLGYCLSEGTPNAYLNIFNNCECGVPFIATDYNTSTCGDGNYTLVYYNVPAGTWYIAINPDLGPNYTVTLTGTASLLGRCCYGDPLDLTCEEGVTGCYCADLNGSFVSGGTCLANPCPDPCPLLLSEYSTYALPNAAIDPPTFVDVEIVVTRNITIDDINVGIDATHTFDGDLNIWLESPLGTLVDLTMGNGSLGDNYECTVFDDESTTPIASGTAPFTGTYQPDEPLSTFDGENSVGTWILHIEDTYPGLDSGVLKTVALELISYTCAPIENLTVIYDRANSEYDLAWTVIEETTHKLYYSFDPNNDGNPDAGADPDFTVINLGILPVGLATYSTPDTVVVNKYWNFVIAAEDCGPAIPTGRCCYGNPASPSCVVETSALCEARANDLLWSFGIDCNTDCPIIVGVGGEDCATAVVIPGTPALCSGNNATALADTLAPTCQSNDGHDVWYTFTAAVDGLHRFSLCGTGFDTVLSLYSACGGTELACNDDNGPACTGTASSIDLTLVTGTSYWIRVAGYSTNSGAYTLSVTAP